MPPHEEEEEEEEEEAEEGVAASEAHKDTDYFNVDFNVDVNLDVDADNTENDTGMDYKKKDPAEAATTPATDLDSFLRLVAERDPNCRTEIPVPVTDHTLHCHPYEHVTKLDLSNCGLMGLPDGFETTFPNLSILFLSQNRFAEMPAVIGSCPNLQMVAFKSNGMTEIHPDALQRQLRWLILTNNAISELPDTIGRCVRLQKCMLSGNRISSLPQTMENCTALELIRLASNRLMEPPWPILKLPHLKWMGLSDNPFLMSCNESTPQLPLIALENDDEEEEDDDDDDDDDDDEHDANTTKNVILGRGAGGVTRKVLFCNHHEDRYHEHVAVKRFNCSAMTSDGDPAAERAMASRTTELRLPALIRTIGQTSRGSLVMEYLEGYIALADPPSMRSCSRDVYNNNIGTVAAATTSTGTGVSTGTGFIRGWDLSTAEYVVTTLLETLVALHQAGVTHGDLYGHNILVTQSDDDTIPSQVRIKVSDFGAAYAYDRTAPYAPYVEAMEVRALGVLVQEINEHVLQQPSILLDKLVRETRITTTTTTTTTTQTFDHLWITWRKWQLSAMAKAFDPDGDTCQEEKEGK